MTIKNIFNACENVTLWTICYDDEEFPTDLFNPIILDAIGNYRVRAFSFHPREKDYELKLYLATTIDTAP